MPLHWVDLGTAAGAASLAAAIILLVQLIKVAIPALAARVTGATIALVVSLIIYIIGAVIIQLPVEDALSWGLAWLACAATAIGINAAATQGSQAFVKQPPG